MYVISDLVSHRQWVTDSISEVQWLTELPAGELLHVIKSGMRSHNGWRVEYFKE